MALALVCLLKWPQARADWLASQAQPDGSYAALEALGVSGNSNDATAFKWFLSGMNFLLQCLALPGPFGICGS